MRNPFARLARPDAARPSLRDRAAALKASASRVIRRKPMNAIEAHPDACLLAAANQARPFLAREAAIEAEFLRADALADALAVERFGPRPDPRTDWDGMQAFDIKRDAVRDEVGRSAAYQAMSENSDAIWALLGPFAETPAQTLEGVAAKSALAASDLWDADCIVREMAVLFYGSLAETPVSASETNDMDA